MNEYIFSPLRYPGGKARIYKELVKIIEKNKLSNYTYIEPYAGGSGLALALLFNSKVKKIHLNDLDRSIYAFWYSVLYNTEELVKLIINVEVTIEERERQKVIQANKGNEDLLALGFSTLFLNRTNRSGIIKAGVIGGKEQSGSYKLDCRFDKVELIRRITNISKYKTRISISNNESMDLINSLIGTKNTFLYLDPPYYNKGPELYMNYFKHNDHEELSSYLSKLRIKHIVSYDDCNEIRKLYHGYKYRTYTLNHNVSNKGKGKEIMFFSKWLKIPDNIFIKK
ncbi:MAG: DNA adenine methylase [Tenericutes bacterium]|nr:DNA adenine methylase [Mycoplasmatota bacterium]